MYYYRWSEQIQIDYKALKQKVMDKYKKYDERNTEWNPFQQQSTPNYQLLQYSYQSSESQSQSGQNSGQQHVQDVADIIQGFVIFTVRSWYLNYTLKLQKVNLNSKILYNLDQNGLFLKFKQCEEHSMFFEEGCKLLVQKKHLFQVWKSKQCPTIQLLIKLSDQASQKGLIQNDCINIALYFKKIVDIQNANKDIGGKLNQEKQDKKQKYLTQDPKQKQIKQQELKDYIQKQQKIKTQTNSKQFSNNSKLNLQINKLTPKNFFKHISPSLSDLVDQNLDKTSYIYMSIVYCYRLSKVCKKISQALIKNQLSFQQLKWKQQFCKFVTMAVLTIYYEQPGKHQTHKNIGTAMKNGINYYMNHKLYQFQTFLQHLIEIVQNQSQLKVRQKYYELFDLFKCVNHSKPEQQVFQKNLEVFATTQIQSYPLTLKPRKMKKRPSPLVQEQNIKSISTKKVKAN